MGKHRAPQQHARMATGLALSASLTLMATPAFAQTTPPPEVPASQDVTPGPAAVAPTTPAAQTSAPTSTTPAAPRTTTPPPLASAGAAAHATVKTKTPARPTPNRQVLKEGDKGTDVMELQRSLAALGYWCGNADGHFGHATTQAVMALQKVAGLERDATFGPATAKALDAKTRPAAKSRRGLVIEINKALQVLLYVKDGTVQTIINTSTGNGKPYDENGSKGVANTPTGTFSIFRQVEGWHKAALGELYFPKYFTGGYAIHGSNSIPAYPASHGCARVSLPAMDMLWKNNILPMGRTVMVYEK